MASPFYHNLFSKPHCCLFFLALCCVVKHRTLEYSETKDYLNSCHPDGILLFSVLLNLVRGKCAN